MASLVKRTRKDGSRSWFVKYRAGDGRVRWERFASVKEAQARKAAVEVELTRSRGTWSPPAPVTFETAAEAYARKKEALRPQTLANYRSALDVWLLPAFGPRQVASLRVSEVEALRAKLAAAGKGGNTIANIVGVRYVLGDLAPTDSLTSTRPRFRAGGSDPVGHPGGSSCRRTERSTDFSPPRGRRRGPFSKSPPRSDFVAPNSFGSGGPTSTSRRAR